MTPEHWDALVVGAGQAGPALAVRLAQAGHRTALIERDRLGGTCVNTGCTPTKTLVASARVAALARRAADFGVGIGGEVSIDFARVMERMRGVVGRSSNGLEEWLTQTKGLELVRGHARFSAPDTLVVGERVLKASKIFLNVGCRPVVPDWARDSGVAFLTSDTLLSLEVLPAHLAIVGGGAIGLEFAQIFRRLGSQVTLFEMGDRLLPREDMEAAVEVRAALEGDGVRFELGSSCFGLERGEKDEPVVVSFACGPLREHRAATHVLVAVGRQPNTEDLGLDLAGVATDKRGFIRVDGQLRTSVAGIWALGDVNGRGAFTHTSWNDHEVVAANLLDGEARSIDERVARYALYVDPPLARIGDSEHQARERGGRVLVGRMPMENVGRARERSETRGFMKVLVDADSMRLLGATFVCIEADEVIHSLIAIMNAGVDVRSIATSVPIHPTVSELIPTMLQRLQPL
ncbi:FAD-containing oxidoreductase [Variovorax sp. Sphag1AA]|uniref:FAD-containing oxidoreductase n=1 Tax=Variovorax sp. Sphag1AA TaxID=2587027 RepID=UPI001620CB33|nr:FAD-containing oxidoreductase [Variovorax sp. Sphag1AA]MBB3178123.1 pyruvate/2-oxoglutarate dehydrogenase complex dihydrolipoamide dehydrogenase (E3) component [Variovorax sp. Sphag1AA]